ncbi:MAG: hypothetical protein ISR65_00345 [Bacteriovoracaceae bacterium]|nr:hypothetical protein [Bacteriovoracaceae bacterium]
MSQAKTEIETATATVSVSVAVSVWFRGKKIFWGLIVHCFVLEFFIHYMLQGDRYEA